MPVPAAESCLTRIGQFVVTGEPIAVMGGGAQSAVGKAGGASQPVLYVEFRKDGIPVRSRPVVGCKRRPESSRMIMRKTSLILLGAAAGLALTLIPTPPPIVFHAAPPPTPHPHTY